MSAPSPPRAIEATTEFDAIVVATASTRDEVVLGLTLAERARRIATRAGARRVLVWDGATDLHAWHRGGALLVLRGGDQLVHTPLVKPLVEGSGDRRYVVGADDAFGGAVFVTDGARMIDELVKNPAFDRAPDWLDTKIVHGDIARHPASTPAERNAAAKMLVRILVKPTEDSPVSQYIYRPLSKPITLLLLHTPITPNQITIFVGILGLIGCFLTALPGQAMLIWGAALVFIAGIIDGCDGEVARLKLQSSPIGAWLDTIVDEVTSVAYFIAIGYHTYALHPESWIGASIPIGLVCYVSGIYGIYYFCIVVLKAGGSQYYVGTLDVVEDERGVGLRARPRAPSSLPPWMLVVGQWTLYIIRRDFINLAAFAITLVNGYRVIYAGIWIGAVVSGLIVTREHIRLRGQLREVIARGGAPRLVA